MSVSQDGRSLVCWQKEVEEEEKNWDSGEKYLEVKGCMPGRKQEGDEEFGGDLRLISEALDTHSHSSTTCCRYGMYLPQLKLTMIIECIFRKTLIQMDYSPVTKIDLLVLQMIFQQR